MRRGTAVRAPAAAALLYLDGLRTFPSETSVRYLQAHGVTILLVHSAFYIRGNFNDDVMRLRALPELAPAGTFRWKSGDLTEAFRVAPAAAQRISR